jgi:hypothetical protein
MKLKDYIIIGLLAIGGLALAVSQSKLETKVQRINETNITTISNITKQLNNHAAIIKYMFKASQQTNHNTQVSTNK